jgi:predicted nucleic acid-binding Zn ribbon protein
MVPTATCVSRRRRARVSAPTIRQRDVACVVTELPLPDRRVKRIAVRELLPRCSCR